MEPKFYFTRDKNGNPRHVVVATSEVTDDGEVSVERVGFHPSVAGNAKKGRRPNLTKAAVKDLEEMDTSDVTDELFEEAKKKLAPAANVTAEGDSSDLN